MEEIARVVRVIDKNSAEVEIRRHSACSECGGCGHGKSENARFQVLNPIKAQEGEIVLLEMATSNLMTAVMIIYLLPLIDLIAGYVVGTWLNTTFHFMKGEGFAIICGLIFFALTFVFVKYYDKRAGFKSGFKPRITKVIESNTYASYDNAPSSNYDNALTSNKDTEI